MATVRYKIHVNGIVQGVGFRPFVYRLAHDCRLTGFVFNSPEGVLIEAEGEPEQVEMFLRRLPSEAPPLAKIVQIRKEKIAPNGDTEFVIRRSLRDAAPVTLIPPDMGICEDCLRELFNPRDRRYRYPFINCTNCGPRFTIVYSIPYDRPFTSMRVFEMCSRCAREYHDPADRRFHAQPNACPECGPDVWLCDRLGRRLPCADPITEAVRLIAAGKIVAIRGLGGFHLAVDAFNDQAVNELRKRKRRPAKPFALMAASLEDIRQFCQVGQKEEQQLRSQIRPIVLLRAREDAAVAPSVAPRNRYLGFMLPYTPLHYLILKNHFRALVMTSGNLSEEPIAIANDEAIRRLSGIADAFLLHNREILQRCDDSIVRVYGGEARVLRRSRGFVPAPVFLKTPTRVSILACGPELKNTVALSRGETVFLSQHIGDLDNPEAFRFFEHAIEHLKKILEVEPEAIAYDLHPEYLSTKWALKQESLPKVGVQHHHAHLASVMAENGVEDRIIGLVLDGTGMGTDGTIWGGEVLVGDFSEFERWAWLRPFPLVGGTRAILEPWRVALVLLWEAFEETLPPSRLPSLRGVEEKTLELLRQVYRKGIHAPFTSSCGRLFDGISALLGICQKVDYEAQAAIELEMVADDGEMAEYTEAFSGVQGRGPVDTRPLVRSVVEDYLNGTEVEKISARFHNTLAGMFLRVLENVSQETGIRTVGLSGGVFQNVRFFEGLLERLQRAGWNVLTHREVPTNDGGIALGQVVVADARLRMETSQ